MLRALADACSSAGPYVLLQPRQHARTGSSTHRQQRRLEHHLSMPPRHWISQPMFADSHGWAPVDLPPPLLDLLLLPCWGI